MQSLTDHYLGNPLWSWIAAAIVAAVLFGGTALLKRLIRKRLQPGDPSRPSLARGAALQVAQSTNLPLMLVFSLSAAATLLVLPDRAERALKTVAIAALALEAALWIHGMIGLLAKEGEARAAVRNPGSVTMIRTLGF